MLVFIVKNVFISLVVILLLHYIYNYLKSSLSKPKVKDLVTKPEIRYNEIIEIIKNNETDELSSDQNYLPSASNSNMKNELEEYMNTLVNDSEDAQNTFPTYQSI
jgi:hypothetical protein